MSPKTTITNYKGGAVKGREEMKRGGEQGEEKKKGEKWEELAQGKSPTITSKSRGSCQQFVLRSCVLLCN